MMVDATMRSMTPKKLWSGSNSEQSSISKHNTSDDDGGSSLCTLDTTERTTVGEFCVSDADSNSSLDYSAAASHTADAIETSVLMLSSSTSTSNKSITPSVNLPRKSSDKALKKTTSKRSLKKSSSHKKLDGATSLDGTSSSSSPKSSSPKPKRSANEESPKSSSERHSAERRSGGKKTEKHTSFKFEEYENNVRRSSSRSADPLGPFSYHGGNSSSSHSRSTFASPRKGSGRGGRSLARGLVGAVLKSDLLSSPFKSSPTKERRGLLQRARSTCSFDADLVGGGKVPPAAPVARDTTSASVVSDPFSSSRRAISRSRSERGILTSRFSDRVVDPSTTPSLPPPSLTNRFSDRVDSAVVPNAPSPTHKKSLSPVPAAPLARSSSSEEDEEMVAIVLPSLSASEHQHNDTAPVPPLDRRRLLHRTRSDRNSMRDLMVMQSSARSLVANEEADHLEEDPAPPVDRRQALQRTRSDRASQRDLIKMQSSARSLAASLDGDEEAGGTAPPPCRGVECRKSLQRNRSSSLRSLMELQPSSARDLAVGMASDHSADRNKAEAIVCAIDEVLLSPLPASDVASGAPPAASSNGGADAAATHNYVSPRLPRQRSFSARTFLMESTQKSVQEYDQMLMSSMSSLNCSLHCTTAANDNKHTDDDHVFGKSDHHLYYHERKTTNLHHNSSSCSSHAASGPKRRGVRPSMSGLLRSYDRIVCSDDDDDDIDEFA